MRNEINYMYYVSRSRQVVHVQEITDNFLFRRHNSYLYNNRICRTIKTITFYRFRVQRYISLFGFKPICTFLRFISEAFMDTKIARKVLQNTSIYFKLNTIVP